MSCFTQNEPVKTTDLLALCATLQHVCSSVTFKRRSFLTFVCILSSCLTADSQRLIFLRGIRRESNRPTVLRVRVQ